MTTSLRNRVAKALGLEVIEDPRAIALLLERLKPEDLNAARRRMARLPVGAELVQNSVSKAPGFKIENVIVMAGVPRIMQAMLDDIVPRLETGTKMLMESIDATGVPEGAYAAGLAAIAEAHPRLVDRLLSVARRWPLPQRDRRARQGRRRNSLPPSRRSTPCSNGSKRNAPGQGDSRVSPAGGSPPTRDESVPLSIIGNLLN